MMKSQLTDMRSMQWLKIASLAIIFSLSVSWASAQNRTISSDGNWATAGIWTGGLIADTPVENAILNNNVDVTLTTGQSYTIGALDASANNTSFSIASGASLTATSFTGGNNGVLTINGDLIINGNFTVNNNLSLVVTGNLIITGNVILNNNATLNVSGSMDVGGNFQAGSNTNIAVNGTVNVDGDVSVGNGSTLTGTGTFSVGGTCNGPICNDSQLPVILLSFTGKLSGTTIELEWVTTYEENFDRFIIQRSANGIDFEDIGERSGVGFNIFDIQTKYNFDDVDPVSGFNYYRLKAIDLDGSLEYFGVVSVKIELKKNASIYPNPFLGDLLNVKINFNPSETDKVTVTNQFGIEVASFKVTDTQNALVFAEPLKPGLYILKYSGPDFEKTIRAIVK